MERANPINVRKSLEMVELFKSAGIDFIPVPVATEKERNAMIEMAISKLEDVEETEKGYQDAINVFKKERKTIITKTNVFTYALHSTNITQLESLMYDLADVSLDGYKEGVQWEFVETHCGAKYMRFPYEGERYLHFQDNRASVGFDAAGVAMTLMNLNYFSEQLFEKSDRDAEKVLRMFYKLRDYATGHAQSYKIFKFID